METVTLTFALTCYAGFLAFAAAYCVAYVLNARENASARLFLAFRINGRTFTSAGALRAYRLSRPLPAPAPKRFNGLRPAPASHEAPTVPSAPVPVPVVALRSVVCS